MAFTTTMRDHMDNAKYPPMTHETQSAAFEYAKIRTSEKNCDITVQDHNGRAIGVFEDGRLKEN